MVIMPGTVVKWTDRFEPCEDGQCVGKVTNVNKGRQVDITVHWWQLCENHQECDPTGTGPYTLGSLGVIGHI